MQGIAPNAPASTPHGSATTGSRARHAATAAIVLSVVGVHAANAQRLEPRAYAPVPVAVNIVGVAYAHSSGGALVDPTLPFSDVSARLNFLVPSCARTFGLLGRTASAGFALPYVSGTVDGNVGETYRRADRSGLADASFRLAVNLAGNPALTARALAARKPSATLGASVTVTAPTGQYDGRKLINLGTNRWAFLPELGLSYPRGPWWLEASAGVWLFTENHDYFGGQRRAQNPITVAQAHVVRTLGPRAWSSVDGTYYAGGETSLNGIHNADRQSNARAGATLAYSMTRSHVLRLAYARGVFVRMGARYDTITFSWQFRWFAGPRERAGG